MSRPAGFIVSVGDVLYRAEAHVFSNEFGLRVDVVVNRYEVVRVTGASYFVDDMKFRFSRPMRRSRTAVNLWARKTEEGAMRHLERRSVSRMGHALRRLEEARAVLRKLNISDDGDAL